MGAVSDSRYTVMASWDDAPHLDEKTKRELLEATPPFLRDARSKGIPSLGAGAIYPITLEEVSVKPFAIPGYWPRGYGLDVGWNRTAAIWLAQDRTDSTLYAYAEHYRGQAEALIHAAGIKARGEWIRGAIDPASRGRAQTDGEQLFDQYRGAGLKLVLANNGVEAGLARVWEMLSLGRLRLFTSLTNLAAEYRVYHRDEDGKIVKQNDHLLDALRYAVMTWDRIAGVQPVEARHHTAGTIGDRSAGY